MGSDLLRRVRWRNVGRAVGAVLVVAAVVAWPRLNAPAPSPPDPVDRPLVAPTVEPPPAAGRPRREVARPHAERPTPAEPRPRAARRRRSAPTSSPVPATTVVPRDDGVAVPDDRAVTPRDVVPPARPAPTPTPDPAEDEFGFEG
jgi:hypothetical protein